MGKVKMRLMLKNTMDKFYSPEGIIGFRFIKERYTPYSILDITAISSENYSDIREIRFELNGKLIHSGIMDNMTVTKSGGETRLRISSRGFTSMLSQNELEPGLLTSVSLNSLMNSVYIPRTTWQSSAQTARYIYVKEHDSVWSAIVSLGLTVNGQYPYIGCANEIRISPKSELLTAVPENIYEEGEIGDYSKMVSYYHMKDAEGNYTYNYTDGFAEERGIVRHKYINFDKQFIALNDCGLQYRLNFTERGCNGRFVSYLGWCGEELRDKLRFPDGTVEEVSLIDIRGNAKRGVFTKTVCYHDKYCNADKIN